MENVQEVNECRCRTPPSDPYTTVTIKQVTTLLRQNEEFLNVKPDNTYGNHCALKGKSHSRITAITTVLIGFNFWAKTLCPLRQRIHSFSNLTTGPKPPPKRCLHIVRSRASSFKWEYPLLSLGSSSSFSRLLPRLLATSISPFIFPSITCFRRQFLRKCVQYS